MNRSVVITGLGPISGLGLGIEPTWQAVLEGNCAIAPLQRIDASGFACRIGSEVEGFQARQVVPKTYRKAVKVMARDIELAVGAADSAARDAALITPGTAAAGDADNGRTYPSDRIGANIGAALIAADADELTQALAVAADEQGDLDIHKFGREGINHVTPLWLLKYLPNMLACHVTIIHDTHGPSNTITCNEASSHLSIGESLRVIQRGAADVCFSGGAESRLDLLGYLRNVMGGRLNTTDNDNPAQAVRPFCKTAAGAVCGEGGAIVILEAADTFQRRSGDGARAYALLKGFGASQTVNLAARNLEPDPQGRGIATAITAALRDAEVEPGQIDMIVPFGLGLPAYDQAEAEALRSVFGQELAKIPVVATRSLIGNLGAGGGAVDTCIAAKSIQEQTIAARINCSQPLPGLDAGNAPSRSAKLNHVLTYSTSLGGQNAALVLAALDA